MMQIEGGYITEAVMMIEYIESTEDPLIQIVSTHQHHTNSVLLHKVKNFTKAFQSETKQTEKVITQSIKIMKKKDNSHLAQTKNYWIRNSPIDG